MSESANISLTARELAVIGTVLQITPDGQYRTFPIANLKVATEMWKKISEKVAGEGENKNYIDAEIPMNTDEKVFIRELVNTHRWGVGDGEIIPELIQKLS